MDSNTVDIDWTDQIATMSNQEKRAHMNQHAEVIYEEHYWDINE